MKPFNVLRLATLLNNRHIYFALDTEYYMFEEEDDHAICEMIDDLFCHHEKAELSTAWRLSDKLETLTMI